MLTPRAASSHSRVLLNVVSNWSGQIFLIGLGFFLAPFVVRHLGDSAYGVWTLTRSLAGYMALLDLGVRGAVTRYVARFFSRSDHEAASRTAASAAAIFLVIALLAAVVSSLLALLVIDHVDIPSEYRVAAAIVLVLAGVNVGVTLMAGVYSGIVAGLQRFEVLNTIEIAAAGVNGAAVFLALRSGQGILTMAAIQLTVSVCRLLALALLCRRLYPELRIRPRLANSESARTIFSFSVFSFVMQVSGNLIYYCDAAVIGAFLPISLLTFFSIGGTLVDYTRTLVSAVSQATSPLASAIDAQRGQARLQTLLLNSATFSSIVVLPIAVTFLIRGESFIALWMGPSYAPLAGRVLAILTLPLLFHSGAHGTGGILMGIGKHKPLAPLMVVEGLCNLGLSIVLVRRMGIVGVAWGTTIPNVMAAVLFWPWYACRTLEVAPARFLTAVWVRPAIAVAPFAIATYVVDRQWAASTLYGFMFQVALCVPVALAGFWFICLNASHRQIATGFVRGRFHPQAIEPVVP